MHFPYPPEILKLKGKDVKQTRLLMLERQGYICTLCAQPCADDQAVLDHDHARGHVRSVLHRGCNAAEGKIMNTMRRYGIKNPLEFLKNLILYQETHVQNRTGLIHPTFRTPEQKVEAAKKRAKKKRAELRKLKQK